MYLHLIEWNSLPGGAENGNSFETREPEILSIIVVYVLLCTGLRALVNHDDGFLLMKHG